MATSQNRDDPTGIPAEAGSVTTERVRGLISERRFAEAQIACLDLADTDPARLAALRDDITLCSADRTDVSIGTAYHRWYYDSLVWQNLTWFGVPVLKSPLDLWSYQEIIAELRPSLIVEFGTFAGGSSLFFRSVLDGLGLDADVLTVDVVDSVHPVARAKAGIRYVSGSSSSHEAHELLLAAAAQRPGPIFAILDSDHRQEHVYAEMLALRDVLKSGDYLVVEDGNVNGHPILPDYGNGPYEAIVQYTSEFPDDYVRDSARELKFGFTFAPRGFLRRQA